jgi:hypothetical protein
LWKRKTRKQKQKHAKKEDFALGEYAVFIGGAFHNSFFKRKTDRKGFNRQ